MLIIKLIQEMGASRSQAVVVPVRNGVSSTSVVYNNSGVIQPVIQPMPIT